VVIGSVAPQDPAAPSRKSMRRRSKPSKRGLYSPPDEIAGAHPEAERFEIWSQDEAWVGQRGRTGYVWWQRGQTPRGLRDVGFQSAGLLGPCRRATPASRW
jgi:hypothetical protein